MKSLILTVLIIFPYIILYKILNKSYSKIRKPYTSMKSLVLIIHPYIIFI